MERVTRQLYLFLFAALGMIGCVILICMGHNGIVQKAFLGLNAAAISGGIIKSFKGGK